VINLDWNDARDYAAWFFERTEGLTCGLPSEAEWEYAARAGSTTPWYWGDDGKVADEFAWYDENSDEQTHPVGGKRPNASGLHDMAGNVWEWVEDCWHENYSGAPEDGRAWLEDNGGDCRSRVLRGGYWRKLPVNLRSADRSSYPPSGRNNFIGFRLVCRPHRSPPGPAGCRGAGGQDSRVRAASGTVRRPRITGRGRHHE
jgi:formylglycine-generating enzyme required for sulfatase activity